MYNITNLNYWPKTAEFIKDDLCANIHQYVFMPVYMATSVETSYNVCNFIRKIA